MTSEDLSHNELESFQSDAIIIEKLQHKLEMLNKQAQKWKAKSKVLEPNGACSFDLYIEKGKQKGKGHQKRREWSELSLPQQYMALKQIAKEHNRVHLDFEVLSMALKQTLISSSLKKAFQFDDSDEGAVELEERNFLKEMLEEQEERSERIFRAESERVDKEIELLKAKCELATQFYELKDQYSSLIDNEDHRIKKSKSSSKTGLVDKKVIVLEVEEKRLEQMKMMIQKLIMSVPEGILNLGNEDDRKKSKRMLIKCGYDVETLRNEKL